MIRDLRAFVLVLALISTTGAAAAAAAQAEPNFQADGYPAILTAHSEASNHVFTINKGPWKCKTHHFEAEFSEASTTMTVFPQYKNCTFVGLSTTMNMNGCHYLFRLDEGSTGPLYLGTFDVICPGANKIKLTSLQCTSEIGPQGGVGGVLFENVGGGDIDLELNVSGITYNTSGSCGISEASNGTYVGTALAEGFNDSGEPTDIFVE